MTKTAPAALAKQPRWTNRTGRALVFMIISAGLAAPAFAEEPKPEASEPAPAAESKSSPAADTIAKADREFHAGIGISFAWWESEELGSLQGPGVRLGWSVYGPWSLDSRFARLEATTGEIETTVSPLEFLLAYRFHLNRYLAPYLGAGAGYFPVEITDRGATPWAVAENTVGYIGLAGLRISLGRYFSLFGDVKYYLLGEIDGLAEQAPELNADNPLDGPAYTVGFRIAF